MPMGFVIMNIVFDLLCLFTHYLLMTSFRMAVPSFDVMWRK